MARSTLLLLVLGIPLLLAAGSVWPQSMAAGSGRLLATGGATTIDGSAGGGVVPWAVIAGYGTADEWGGSAFVTRLDTGDYGLESHGVAIGWRNRIEFSLAQQRLRLPTLARVLGLPTARFDQDVIGMKWRIGGDLVYSDRGQWALGVQHRRQHDFAIPQAVGAIDDSGTDVYLSGTRLFLGGPFGRNWLLNGTLRSTRANQGGLLGFGGDRRSARSLQAEVSLVVLLDRYWAAGVEYRQKPDNLGFAAEDNWRDAFIGWFPNKRVAVVAAWVDLGSVATLQRQRGWYLSLQVSR